MKKWKDKTRGGHPVEIWKEVDETIYGRISVPSGWPMKWDTNGESYKGDRRDPDFDLVPVEPERIVIEDVKFVRHVECDGSVLIYPKPKDSSYWDYGVEGKRGRLIFEVEDEG